MLFRSLAPHLAQLSTVVAILVDSAGDGFAGALKERGIACLKITVDAKLTAAIERGEALAW